VFEEHATRGNLVPVVRELLADMDTPLSLFRRLDDERTAFLFESVEGGEKWGRYSFIGTGARAIFRARGREVEWEEGGRTERVSVSGDPLEFLRERLAALHAMPAEGAALPRFLGGPGRDADAGPVVRAPRDDRRLRQRAEDRLDRASREARAR
jgi:anthranilate synthase component 1